MNIQEAVRLRRLSDVRSAICGSSPLSSSPNIHKYDQLKMEFQSLKYDYCNAKNKWDMEKTSMEKKIHEIEQNNEEKEKRINELEKDKRFLYEKHKLESEETQKLREECSAQKQEYEWKIRELQRINSIDKENSTDRKNEERSVLNSLQRKIETLELKNTGLEKVVEGLKDELRSKNTLINQKQQSLLEANELIDNLQKRKRSLEVETNDSNEIKVLNRELIEQLSYIKSLEKKNFQQSKELKQLKESHKSIQILQEEKKDLEFQLKLMDDLRQRLGESEIERAILKREKAAWVAYLDDDDQRDFDSPKALSLTLAQQRIENAALTEKYSILEMELKEKDILHQSTCFELKKLSDRIVELEEKLNYELKNKLRLERQEVLSQKEVELLQEQLNSYNSEEMIFMHNNYDEQKTKRIKNLEMILDDYKIEIMKISEELQEAKNQITSKSTEILKREREEVFNRHEREGDLLRRNKTLSEELLTLNKEHTLLKKELESLKQQLSYMDSTSKNDKHNSQTRILQLKDNPLSALENLRQSTLDRLKNENAALLKQIEDNGEQFGQVVPIESLENLKLENLRLESTIADKEKRIQRLKEIFAEKSSEFREAVYFLLGYKIDFLPSGKVRVTSIYSQKGNHSFVFDGKSSSMHLVKGNEFTGSIENLIKFWCEERKTIPGMLSALTLELFEQSTTGQSKGWA
ncbi:hypothetical protein T552_01547 [Pneumocystis carinii B80]|uniref:Spindle assembly checkpoint component MAD1 n=1 Tax=Pneumocystis carinii (strain B80) TaxID=1408658 RepID=A0A0W4ZKL8_PNEC8|nr:hypothetical protein T552_01547 [Pneumocystis carinii B80]KTW28919.1 hypothetical protein T552_01547 [Pneumocystis carinii B80]